MTAAEPDKAKLAPAEEVQKRIEADAARWAQERFDQPSEDLLQRAIKFYDSGKYQAAINVLISDSTWKQGSVPLQIRARKILAFSYCTLHKMAQCRKAFDEILLSSPTFELLPLEVGNPNWDPVFRQAQGAVATRRLEK